MWVLLLCAPMATTGIIRMLARLMAITARTTLWVASSSAQARGFMASTDVLVSTVAVSMDADSTGDLVSLIEDAASAGAAASNAVASAAAREASTAVDTGNTPAFQILNWQRGSGRPLSPATPPDVRVRIGRFSKLSPRGPEVRVVFRHRGFAALQVSVSASPSSEPVKLSRS